MSMLRQTPYSNPEMPPSDPHLSHMALVLVLDTSASMTARGANGKSLIQELNDGVNRFKQEVLRDSSTEQILDVAIIRFDSTYEVIQGFRPIRDMVHVDLPANGYDTIYSPAIKEAIRMVKERSDQYRQYRRPYKPWILFITDGAPNPNDSAGIQAVAQEIAAMVQRKEVSFRSLAVGSDKENAFGVLRTLSNYGPSLTVRWDSEVSAGGGTVC